MASAYSQDLRDRVIDAVVRGEMSRRAAAGALWGERVLGHQVGAALRTERFPGGEQDGRIPPSEA
jgi:hypothetical protein